MNKIFSTLLSAIGGAAKDVAAQVIPAVIGNVTSQIVKPAAVTDQEAAAATYVQANPSAILSDAFAAGAAWATTHHTNVIGDMISHAIVALTGANEAKVDALVDVLEDVVVGGTSGGVVGAVGALVGDVGEILTAVASTPVVAAATATVTAGKSGTILGATGASVNVAQPA